MSECRISSRRRTSLKTVLIALIVITCVTPRELTIISFQGVITRPNGSAIILSIPMLLAFVLWFMSGCRLKVKKSTMKAPILVYFGFACASFFFVVFNRAMLSYYSVAAWKYIMFVFMFIVIAEQCDFYTLQNGIDIGFRWSLIIQTISGMLSVFLGIVIPFVGNTSSSIRNGLPRMVGSFAHPGDFGLYISILFVYFLCKVLFDKELNNIPYAVLGFIDIYLSGGRTMLVVSAMVTLIILMSRYKRNVLLKFLFVVVAGIGGYWFTKSDAFADLFIRHNIFDMLMARFIHWILGFRIMADNVINFILGVGLNNRVDYIDANYSDYAALVSSASSVLDSEFVKGMPIHNSYLIAGCELGIVGLLLYVNIFVHNIRVAIRVQKKQPLLRTQCMFVIAATLVVAIYCMQGWAMHKTFAWTMVTILAAYVFHLNRQKDRE